ncbi:FG-GAP-like repeat-containing protein [Hymenobacter crusticola]|uniref:IPT/TIG domain-containing protein n=1 Tax=Hymenobacter crusticola TaxID=1770526 RepID=A0A243W6Z5_9BACT|nr:FG-GAP-like repeat-containing protein [Hymenobacter crusticola]OUJ70032.1 hypothetical protein BXP70_25510 [Hymenobacter crusticola]
MDQTTTRLSYTNRLTTKLPRFLRSGLMLMLLGQIGAASAQAPVVTSLSPTRNARTAPRTTTVAISLSQPLSNNASTQGALKVFSQQVGGKQAGTAVVSGSTLSFTPGISFKPGETIFTTITSAAQSATGSAAIPHVFQFTTATAPSPGTFTGGSDPAVGANPQEVTLGDVDGDGDLDLLTANYVAASNSFGTVSVRLNNGSGSYSGGAEVSVGIGPYQVILGDVDSDGDLDLLTANANSGITGTVSVRLNNGNGSFSGTTEVAVGTSPHGLALGDVDGDGDLDLLAANYTVAGPTTTSTVSVRLNTGNGTFSSGPSPEVSVGPRPIAVVLGDADSDGDLDLFTANSSGTTVSLRLNNGSGSFSGTTEINVNSTPHALALGDIDGDGDLDLLATNTYGNPSAVAVRLNNGSGSFSGTQVVPTGAGPRSLALADVDGDGDLDFITANSGNFFSSAPNGTTASIRLNNGSGTFSGTQNVTVGMQPNDVAVGDVDADGDLDFVTANTVSNTVSVRLNQPLALPVITSLSPTAGPPGSSVVITGTFLSVNNSVTVTGVTFNGVPAASFVVNSATQIRATVPAGATSGPLVVVTTLGASNGMNFNVVPPLAVTAVSPVRNARSAPRNTVVAVTFDQPLSPASSTAVRVFSQQAGGAKAGAVGVSGSTLTFNPTTGFKPGETVSATITTNVRTATGTPLLAPHVFQFTTATSPSTGTFDTAAAVPTGLSPAVAATADVDGDGDLDLLVANSGINTVSVRLNNGNGIYTGSREVTVFGNVLDLAVGDVDGDGDLDFVTAPVSFSTGNILSIRLNDGAGNFSSGVNASTFGEPLSITLGDVDGDADLDLLVGASIGVGTVNVLLNDGTGRFLEDYAQSITVRNPTELNLGDIDNDGDLDLLTVYTSGSAVNVALNNGNGRFASPQSIGVGSSPYLLALGDVDGDNDLDFITTSSTTNALSLRLNNGSGAFSNGSAFTQTNNPTALRLGDIDGDSDLDLLLAYGNSSVGAVSVRLNNGTGSFSGNQEVVVGNQPTAIALGDVDGNGTLDLVTANLAANTASVSLNLNQPPPVISSLSPGRGPAGTRVVITGANFLNFSTVTFTGVPVAEVISRSATQLVALVPAGTTSGPVVVTTPSGTSNGVFFTITSPLLVTAVVPARNASAAPRTTPVAVTFDQALNTSSVFQQALNVFGQQTGLKAGRVAASGSTLTFTPGTGFKPGETGFATVTSMVQSTTGIPAKPHVFQFTAATAPAAGTFGGGSDLSVGTNPVAIATGDVDGDGDLDLAVASIYSVVSVRLNNGSGSYSGGQDVSVGRIPRDLIFGDVDGDGDLDLLVSDDQNSKISVRLNNGSGSFSGDQEVSVDNSPQSQALGDIDGDGDLDLVTANASGTASVRFNTDGIFSGTQEVSLGGTLLRVALGDVDSDGDLDLLTTNSSGFVNVRLNDSAGTFSGTTNVPVGGYAYSLATGDVDKDGDLDLVIGNFYNFGGGNDNTTVSVRLNKGDGTFSGNQEVLIGASIQKVELGDVDGDGDLDLLAANLLNASGAVSVRLNNGSGTFSGVQEVAVLQPSGLAIGDVDGDGDLDLLTSSNASSGASIRLNQAVAAPSISGISPAISPVGSTVVITGHDFLNTTGITFNGVAATSFVLSSTTQLTVTIPAGATSGPVVVTTNVGASNGFQFTVGPLLSIVTFNPARNATAAPPTTPVALTFNRELSTSAATLGALKVFSTQSGGQKAGTASVGGNTLTFTPSAGFKPGETVFSTVTTAVTSSGNQSFLAPYVFQFTAATAPAAGIFGGTLEASVGTNPQSVAIGDVDGDGDLDLLTANNLYNSASTSTVSVRLNNGSGIYTGMQEVRVGTGPYSVKLADVDGDGDLDLVTANASSGQSNTISVRLNNGSGLFSGTQNMSVGNLPHDIALGDVDGDGDVDLLVANYVTFGPNYETNSTVSVRLNNGSGIFSTTGQDVVVGPRPLHLALGDVDKDGDLDFVTANSSGTTASVRLNNGTGTFSGTQEVTVGFSPQDIVLGDVDRDGDLDLLTANYYDYTNPADNFTNSTVGVRLNDGNGIFSGTQQVWVGQGASSIVLGDANGDGDLDLFATNNLTRNIGVRLNNGTGTFSGLQQVAVGINPAGITLGDVDGNGTLDILVANNSSNTVSVRLNQVTATATTQARVLATVSPQLAEQVSLYPNPARTYVRLQLPRALTQKAVQVRMLNALGQVMLNQKFTAQQAADGVELTLGELAVGIYTVHVHTADGIVTKRLAVE